MNLIICMTPLQTLIAEKIILKHKGTYILIYLTYTDNEKHRYYFNKLLNHCAKGKYIVVDNSNSFKKLYSLYLVSNTLKKLGVVKNSLNDVYLSCIDTFFIHYCISNIKFNHLITFDDGTANIFPNSGYFLSAPESKLKKIFKDVFKFKYASIEDCKERASWHYTIFPDEKNIIENTKVISLFDQEANLENKNMRVQRIFLGQILDIFIGAEAYRDIVTKIHEEYNVESFYPHPRENLTFNNINVIKSKLIVEDYVINQLTKDSDLRIEIYTITSTAAINLNHLNRVKVFVVVNKLLKENFDGISFFQERDYTILNITD